MAVQKPAIGLVQIAFHQALADAVLAHQRKTGLSVGSERLEGHRGNQQQKNHHSKGKQELLGGADADLVADGECDVERDVGLHQLGGGQHRHEW